MRCLGITYLGLRSRRTDLRRQRQFYGPIYTYYQYSAKLAEKDKEMKGLKDSLTQTMTLKLYEKDLEIKQFKEQIKGLKASDTKEAKSDKAALVEFGSSISAAKSELEKLKADTAIEAKKLKSAKFIPFFGVGTATEPEPKKRVRILFHKYGNCSGEGSRLKVPSLVIG